MTIIEQSKVAHSIFSLYRIENIMGKGENAGCYIMVFKSLDYVVKSEPCAKQLIQHLTFYLTNQKL